MKVLLLGFVWVVSGIASAQSCWIPGTFHTPFGPVSATKPTDRQTTAPFMCNGPPTYPYIRLCLSVDLGSSGTVAPRYLQSNAGNHRVAYELYTDAARTQPIGPRNTGSSELTWTARLPADQGQWAYTQVGGDMRLYGRVFAGQGYLKSEWYRETNLRARLAYAFGSTSFPETCTSGDVQGETVDSFEVSASIASGCRITALSDLDFGHLHTPLSTPRDQATSLSLQCPQGTAWQIGMGPGNHHATTRRMSNGSGGYVRYELYGDVARTQVWGDQLSTNTVSGTGSAASIQLPIHGRIPSQGHVPSGIYTDTVIITLTY